MIVRRINFRKIYAVFACKKGFGYVHACRFLYLCGVILILKYKY
jgi:hypothetical protein